MEFMQGVFTLRYKQHLEPTKWAKRLEFNTENF